MRFHVTIQVAKLDCNLLHIIIEISLEGNVKLD